MWTNITWFAWENLIFDSGCVSCCSLSPPSRVLFAVIMNTSDCTDVDFEHLVSKQPAAIYCPLLNDKVLAQKETQQSSQHGLRAAGIWWKVFMDWLGFRGHHFFLTVIAGDLHFLRLHPNSRKAALVYFCLMLKQEQPLEMTNRLIRLVRPAAEPARLWACSTPWWLRLFSCGDTKHDQTTVGKCVWCRRCKAVWQTIIGWLY